MKLKFKDQEFQQKACNSICNIFEGQPKVNMYSYLLDPGKIDNQLNLVKTAYKNAGLRIYSDDILKNLNKIQTENNIKRSEKLSIINGKYNFSVEMETGTGKTYTYIKTIFELNKRYGWGKFIIVVPSIAIREGVNKTFQITKEHFFSIYNKQINFFIYNSSDLSNIRSFAEENKICVMIINYQAFNAIKENSEINENEIKNKDVRKIFQRLEELQSRRPIDFFASTNPILIIDEPQSVEGKETKKTFNKDIFNALFTLRYSATHKEKYDMVYTLDAIDAYNQKLVKKIEVKGISLSSESAVNGYLYLHKINKYPNKSPDALLEFNVKEKNIIRKKERRVEIGFDLYVQSGNLDAYKNYVIEDIVAKDEGYILFTNGVKLNLGEICGCDDINNQLRRIQIRETIKSHLEKECRLFKDNIKVLSLFFIDEVAKYKDYSIEDQKGEYAKIFEEEYSNIVNEYINKSLLDDKQYVEYLKSFQSSQIHAGYFSIDKKGHIVNSEVKRKSDISDDVDAYDLIMKDKERLLSFEEPVRFIFSHSALKEGWDNPNVFQICTLRERSEKAEIRKRQEIGRGLRLCVNKDGDRQDMSVLGRDKFHKVNVLTVIASESYKDFTIGLQNEIKEAVKDRPTEITINLFKNRVFFNTETKQEDIIDNNKAVLIHHFVKTNGYIDEKGSLLEKYYKDKENNTIDFGNYNQYNNDIISLLDKVYEPIPLPNPNIEKKYLLKKNENMFNLKEFQDLWNKICIKTFYEVNIDDNELINSSIYSLDNNLHIPKTKANVSLGVMNDSISREKVEQNDLFTQKENSSNSYAILPIKNDIKYDLIGKICDETELTRKTIAKILSGIRKDVFEQFQFNSEFFIQKVSNIINKEKSKLIVEKDNIKYFKLNDKFSINDIFIEDEYEVFDNNKDNIIETKKNVFNYVKLDSKIEINFTNDLEKSQQILVYSKLPKEFYISTPIGHYNPDWAIVLKENENTQHIYFIVETKGDANNLREDEKIKTECAKLHFKTICQNEVPYTIVSNLEELINKAFK